VVPPPKSKMSTLRSALPPLALSRPYAIAAAVGSLMMRRTYTRAAVGASAPKPGWRSLAGGPREHVEPSDGACVLGRLALGVVEVGGDGDDGALDGLPEERLRVRLELLQHHGADLLWRKRALLTANLDRDHRLAGRALLHAAREVLRVGLHGALREGAPDEPLRVVDGVAWVGRRLVFGGVADQPRAVLLGKRDPRCRRVGAVGVGDHLDAAGAGTDDRDGRVRRPQIDANHHVVAVTAASRRLRHRRRLLLLLLLLLRLRRRRRCSGPERRALGRGRGELDPIDERRRRRIVSKARCKGLDRFGVPSSSREGVAEAGVSLGPGWLLLDGAPRVGLSRLGVAEMEVAQRAVGEVEVQLVRSTVNGG